MGNYWTEFIKKYHDRISLTPLVKILEAFWHYARGEDDTADNIMNSNKE